jgi:catechol 2,3-dioxygenase-like lactoylglutathione lyase family enzyme
MDPERTLEDRLRGLPLRAPPPSLDAWIGRARHARRRRAGWALAAAAVLAAGGAAGLLHFGRGDGRDGAVAAADAAPLRIDQTWSQTLDGGTVVLDDEPHRLLERQTLRHVFWRDPDRGARYEVTVPQTEIILVAERPY